jgi:hypothetical protein
VHGLHPTEEMASIRPNNISRGSESNPVTIRCDSIPYAKFTAPLRSSLYNSLTYIKCKRKPPTSHQHMDREPDNGIMSQFDSDLATNKHPLSPTPDDWEDYSNKFGFGSELGPIKFQTIMEWGSDASTRDVKFQTLPSMSSSTQPPLTIARRKSPREPRRYLNKQRENRKRLPSSPLTASLSLSTVYGGWFRTSRNVF